MSLDIASSGLAPQITADSPVQKRSGGPRTPEGKDASRRNALKRGLRSKIVFPDDLAELVERRIVDFTSEFAPRTPYETMLVRDMAVSSARFERCASLSVADLVRCADRAMYCWEQDRRASVDEFASRIKKDPQRIARGLRRSSQGCDWLIENWELLAAIARETGRWDDDQRRFAFDMLGVPRELRTTETKVPKGDETLALIALAEAQIARLREDQEAVLDDLSDAERSMAMAGMPLEEDAATARLRKDERRARCDFSRARNELLKFRAGESREESRPVAQVSTYCPSAASVAVESPVEPPPLVDESPEVEVVEEAPAPVATASPAERPKTRRARRELEKRARAAARREAAGSATR